MYLEAIIPQLIQMCKFLTTIYFLYCCSVLGDEFRSLKTLSVCYCGLEDLDGISYAPNLVNLVAAFNAISDVYPITEMRKINTVDLEK